MPEQVPFTSTDQESPTPPSLCLFASELHRATFEMGTLIPSYPALISVPAGEAQPVMVLPGFGANDGSSLFLRRFIDRWGYTAYPWGQGLNLNPREVHNMTDVIAGIEGLLSHLQESLQKISDEHGAKASLIGWSLGGVVAKMLAHRYPDLVRQLITLGTPHGDLRGVSVTHLYARMTGQMIGPEDLDLWASASGSAPTGTPSTAIWSAGDGFLGPETAWLDGGPLSENVRVPSSHVGFGVNPVVYAVIADRLAQRSEQWQPFKRNPRYPLTLLAKRIEEKPGRGG